MSLLSLPVLRGVSRAGLFAFCLTLLGLNALSERAALSLDRLGLAQSAFDLFGVSAIIWFALFAVVRIVLDAEQVVPLRSLDLAVAAAAICAALLPIGYIAAGALFCTSLYLLTTSHTGQDERRIAVVSLALCAPLLWGPILLRVAGRELLGFDGWIVGIVSGFQRHGNVIMGPDGLPSVLIMEGCSSLKNISVVLVLVATITQLFRIPLRRPILLAGALAVVAVVLVNATRIALIAHYPQYYEMLHFGIGAVYFGWANLIVIMAIVGTGVHRATRPVD